MKSSALVIGLLLVGSLASAQEGSERDEEAQMAFELARRSYERGDFREAGEAFERSHAYSPRPELLYNAYIAYRDATDGANAARTLRLYLEQVEETTVSRVILEGRLAALEAELATDAEAVTEPVEPVDESTAAQPQLADPLPAEPSPSGPPIGAIVLTSVGAAAVVTGVITAFVTGGIHSDVSDQCPNQTCFNLPEHQAEIDRGRRFARTTDALLFSGGALILGGVLWWVLGGSNEDEGTSVSATCAETGCEIGARGAF